MSWTAAIEGLWRGAAATTMVVAETDPARAMPAQQATVQAVASHVSVSFPPASGVVRRFLPAWAAPVRNRPALVTPPPPSQEPVSSEAQQAAKTRFALIQAMEQFSTYGVGGVVEGMGKFFQRDGRDRYFDNPAANWFFGPLHTLVQAIAEFLGLEVDVKALGSAGMSAGNLVKVGTNVLAWRNYRAMARSIDYDKIRKAAFGNSWRNACYLVEKGGFTLAGACYATGNTDVAVAAMVVAQTAVLVNAATTLHGNREIITRNFHDPNHLRMARDAAKITAINGAKGLWALTTLGAFVYAQLPDVAKAQLPLNLPATGTADDNYHILVQANWELPPAMIAAGVIMMVVPPALSFALHTKHAIATPEQDITNGARTDRVYHTLGATADVCNGVGGYYTAFLFWQPLGALFNGLGSLFSLAQDRRKAWLNRAVA